MPQKDVEALIKLPDGTEISLKGNKRTVSEIISSVSKERGSGVENQPGAGSNKKLPPAGVDIEGIAEKDEDGKVHIVVHDLKAKTALDAAQRLTYIFLLSRRQLLSERKTPRKTLIESLRSYNLYDGNTRRLLANDRGLVRDGRATLALSQPALNTAMGFVKDVQNAAITGAWQPTRRSRRGRGKSKHRSIRSA